MAISGTLPVGTPNQPYNSVLAVSGGSAPYQFGIKAGSLPDGVSLNPVTGSISGTPVAAGNYSFEVGVADAPRPEHGSQSFTITVTPGGGATGGGGEGIKVNVAPSEVSLVSNQTQQFTARVVGTNNTAVTWSASAGSIDRNGLYTAPQVNQLTNVTVTATSVADKMKHGDAAVTVDKANGQPLTITTNSLPDGQMGNMYDEVFAATGGKQPYTWSATGNVPPGITLNPSSGDFAGMPGAAGTFSFTVTVKDASGQTAQKGFTLNVVAGGGNFDGPAELPRVTVASSLADTPAPGAVVQVSAGSDLQAALNSAQCGNTIALQAGATFSGTFTFPAKNCDSGHWIIVRTNASDSALPAEGQRLTPCYAGVASLPGRPQYPCNHPQNVLAKLVYPGVVQGPITFQSGANHYRLIGLELTRSIGGKGAPILISMEPGGTGDHIVLDRSWLHGTAQDETKNGLHLAGTNYVAAVDSYFSDFHCTSAAGTCTDSHAIGGGLGDHQDGPYKISNNFLEASGEAILFGGGEATLTPADITVAKNHFFKPLTWLKGNPNFVGGYAGNPFIVKNHFELKNAQRVLFEDNLLENVWGGFTQNGHSIALCPKNQMSKTGGSLCPLCEVVDVTIRYSRISHAGNGISLTTSLSGAHTPALAGKRWSIHDVVLDDINKKEYAGGGSLFEVANGWPANPLNTVTINHVTGFSDPNGHLLTLGNRSANPPMYGFVFTNNLVIAAKYSVWSTIAGTDACAYNGTPAVKIANCFTTVTFSNNALIDSPYPQSSWPTGNLFSTDPSKVDFTQYNNGNGGDYELLPPSPYKNKGTDGRDLGADVAGLEVALAGVE